MTTYIEYTFEDGHTILVEADETADGAIKAAGVSDDVVKRVQVSFETAVSVILQSTQSLVSSLSRLESDEIQVSFGIKSAGELGFGICKGSSEANYTVSMKWTKQNLSRK